MWRRARLLAAPLPARPAAPPPAAPPSARRAALSASRPSPAPPAPPARAYATAPRPLVPSDSARRTIFALSSAPGKAGVAVIRVSGPDAAAVWARMVHPPRAPRPWRLTRCTVAHPDTAAPLDDALAVFFRAPRSFTTEDALELHVHAGRAVVAAVLAALARVPGCRAAAPGEFTRRAFARGRLDLTQVEGLRDLVDAETDAQRRAAVRAARGESRAALDELREGIIGCLAMVEALIDFGEGEDIEDGVYEQAQERAQRLCDTIAGHLADSRRGEIIRSGIRLAIFGPPNAGKSSLLNFLAQREAAIVTPVPGTTRDILELSLDLGGLPVIVADTAGLRKTDDHVERIGIQRAKDVVKAADVSLCVLSLPDMPPGSADAPLPLPPDLQPLVTPDTFFLLNKADLVAPPAAVPARPNAWAASLHTGAATGAFLAGFTRALQTRYGVLQDRADDDAPLVTHARHRAHLEAAHAFLRAFLDTPPQDVVLGAEELRYAAQAVGRVSGLIDVEDVLDAVFRDFCIGK